MKKLIIAFIVLSGLQGNAKFKQQNIDYKHSSAPSASVINYGYGMYEWSQWVNRPSSQILFGENNPSQPGKANFPVKVYEFKSSFVVNRPISKFNSDYLLNVNTINSIDSFNNFSKVSVNEAKKIMESNHYYQNELYSDSYVLKSRINLPSNSFINTAIKWYKDNRSQSKNGNSDYSAITTLSELIYQDNLESDIQELLTNSVGVPYKGTSVDRYLTQIIFYSDHFIRFGTNFIHFQKIDENNTLVTFQMVLSINKNILFSYFGVDTEDMLLNGTAIDLCDLCVGLVELSKKNISNMKKEFSK